MSSAPNTRRHRASENPDGLPVPDLVAAYYRTPARDRRQPAATS